MKQQRMSTEAAESIAITCLGVIARDTETLGRFLALTGLGPAEIRAAAQSPSFLRGVLEFVLEDESGLLAIAATAGLRPTEFAIARHTLAGLEDPGIADS